jgi:DNA primase catalytic subunit
MHQAPGTSPAFVTRITSRQVFFFPFRNSPVIRAHALSTIQSYLFVLLCMKLHVIVSVNIYSLIQSAKTQHTEMV